MDSDYSDTPRNSRLHRRRKTTEVVEDPSAKASRADVHRLVKARLERIKAEEKRKKKQSQDGGDSYGDDGKVQVNLGKYASENEIYFHPQIAKDLKQHQVAGVRFMWAELVQSKRNMGALLAHTMGLGKTFQIIALLHTIAMASSSSDPKTYQQIPKHLRQSKSLILCPPGLIDNWWEEFHKWLPVDSATGNLDQRHIGDLHKITSNMGTVSRIQKIRNWDAKGGILIISYYMFRRIVNDSQQSDMRKIFLESPNLIVADEAHHMKNPRASITKAAVQFRSNSRIAITGSPLSNNLTEYWTMIEWIDPGYLGGEKEFILKYARPIEDGLHIDSTRAERRECLKMLRVLNKDLDPKVHRADVTSISNLLPPKTEFLITIPLTPFQKELYLLLIEAFKSKDFSFFDAANLLFLTNNHPMVVLRSLELRKQRKGAGEGKEGKDKDKDAEGDEEMAELDLELSPDVTEQTYKSVKELLATEQNAFARRHSYKMDALKHLLHYSKEVEDRVLIFSQSIATIDLLESYMKQWGVEYKRMDGKTQVSKRQQHAKNFNKGSGDVFLISTRAGGLGLNLPGANRVVIFDYLWNPMWEEQAVGRAYRIGQTKQVFVYRFTAGGTFEDYIRNATEFKQQLATRVVDKKDPRRSSSKLHNQYKKPPTEPVQDDLKPFKGKDVVLDKLL
ncbi:P-loop containing nucleoside triphosphate hydrolase protein, partial [Kalaharituber pfeilii]